LIVTHSRADLAHGLPNGLQALQLTPLVTNAGVLAQRMPAAILGDFAEFRKAGLTHPLMDEIEKQFAGT
jgi:hypothetical protein